MKSTLKIAVLNASGNTGKTTLSKHLFAPLMSAKRVQIEDLNARDGQADVEIGARRFRELAAELAVADNEATVIDIGASAFRAVTEHLGWLEGVRDLVDFWIIPVVPSVKVQRDSIMTVDTLTRLGVEPGRIVLVLNNVTEPAEAPTEFAIVFALREIGVVVCGQAVLSNELFDEIKDSAETVFDVAGDKTDFRAAKDAARAAGDAAELRRIGVRMVRIMAARSTVKNLRGVFESLPFATATA